MSCDDLGDISSPSEFVEKFDSIVVDVENKRGDSLGDRMKSYELLQTFDPTMADFILDRLYISKWLE